MARIEEQDRETSTACSRSCAADLPAGPRTSRPPVPRGRAPRSGSSGQASIHLPRSGFGRSSDREGLRRAESATPALRCRYICTGQLVYFRLERGRPWDSCHRILPDVDPESWPGLPRSTSATAGRDPALGGTRLRHPVRGLSALPVIKIALYVAGAAAVISLTPGLGGLGPHRRLVDAADRVPEGDRLHAAVRGLGPRLRIGTVDRAVLPPIGGFLYWLRPNTIRLPAWPGKVPFTGGDNRTVVDVALYAVVLGVGVWALLSPGQGGPVTAAGDVGLIDPVLVVPTIVALALLGLRDKTVFLAARGEHYWLKLLVFFFPFTDQIAAFKIIMLALWWGAATSKLNHHFPYVVAVMTSNNALLRSRAFNLVQAQALPRPGERPAPVVVAEGDGPRRRDHGGIPGADGPGLLRRRSTVAVVPHRVHGALPPQHHLQPSDGSSLGVERVLHLLAVLPVRALRRDHGHRPQLTAAADHPDRRARGGVRSWETFSPNKISFLPAMRYYAGNWATSMWCFRAGAEDKIDAEHHQELGAGTQTAGQALRSEHRRDDDRQVDGVPVHAHPRPDAQRAGGPRPGRCGERGRLQTARRRNHRRTAGRVELRRGPPAQRAVARGGAAALPVRRRAMSG